LLGRDGNRLFELAMQYHQAGQQDEAERLCRQVIALDPRHADSRHILGIIAAQTGRHESAIELIGQAIALKDDNAFYHNDLGNILVLCGQLDAAEPSFRRALALAPDFALAHYNLGLLFGAQDKFTEAGAAFQRAVALDPNFDAAYYHLGNVFEEQGKFAESAAAFQRAIAISPDHPETYNNLGNVLTAQGKLEDASASFRRATVIRPDYAYAHNNLGNVLKEQGKIDDAIVCYDRALAIQPDYPVAHSNLLVAINYDFGLIANRSEAEARRWNERYGLEQKTSGHAFANDRNPDRRLRIGYVSPDFRRHSVGTFIEPLLHAHDPAVVEIFCYAELRNPDAVTKRLQTRADHWRGTVGMPDEALAQRIREDRIDILIDLAGHTSSNRLPMFAHKPAPVQVTWLGYPATTGLAAMDYRLVDATTDPENESAAAWASEKLVRLQNGFLCYGPPADAPPPAPPPSLASGVITFGSFNNLAKLSPETLDAWAALLHRLPKAQLLLKWYAFADESVRALFHARFAARGIAPERVIPLPGVANIADHLAIYHHVDVALDPFPYNGTTTTCEALWMGVPVVTLKGQRHAGRVGASLLGGLGRDDLVADTVEDYIEIAATLATDSDRRTRLRQELRPLVAGSSLCDAPGFARRIEATYRAMWRNWCNTTPRDGSIPSALSSPAPDKSRNAPSITPAAPSRRNQIAEKIAAFPFWYHRIELPEGLITPGWAPLDPTAYQIPARLDGLRVLDVGAWDGYWTFEALKRGAREVVAIDDFSDYMGDLQESDRKAWATFDLCRDALGYDERQCRRIDMSVYDVSEKILGRFDVVFCFGTLYHLRHPLLALDRLSAVCDGEIFVESAILDDFSPYRGGFGHGYAGGQSVMEFYPRDEYAGNHTNWFVPTVQAMMGLLDAAGFGECRGWKLTERPTALCYCRGFAHGRKVGTPKR
jgi:protein O-GlcNAc transferase